MYRIPTLRSVELCAGAGGLALGLEKAGFHHEMLVEIDSLSCSTLRHNRPNWNVIQDDIANVDFSHIENLDLLSAGIPCQSFSHAGKREGLASRNGEVFWLFKDCLDMLKPKMFLLENVRGLMTHDKGRTFDLIHKELQASGYQIFSKVLNANDFGVAQKRQRIFIIGVMGWGNLDVEFNFPFPYEYKPVLWDAIGDLQGNDNSDRLSYPLEKQKVLSQVPAGGCWVDLPVEIQKEYMGKSFYNSGGQRGMARRISWNEPSLTLMQLPVQKMTERCHPDEERPFTVRESARIQSFPDDWEFKGKTTKQYKQIGNAVPVKLAEAIGKEIAKCLTRIKMEK